MPNLPYCKVRSVNLTRWIVETALLMELLVACGPPSAAPSQPAPASAAVGKRSVNVLDDCAQEPGKPPPEPLRIEFTGVAKSARCQREVYTIMGGITHFLGVECKHCHQEPDYTADTHNKQIANWMARELVPKLRKRAAQAGDGALWCNDCHAGKAKILGSPRQRSFAIDWMATHLVEELETKNGKPPKCKQCHQGDLGSPQFQPKIILSELGGLPAALTSPASPPASSQPASPSAPAAGSAAPLPDYGAR
jgi:hypothetical protein